MLLKKRKIGLGHERKPTVPPFSSMYVHKLHSIYTVALLKYFTVVTRQLTVKLFTQGIIESNPERTCSDWISCSLCNDFIIKMIVRCKKCAFMLIYYIFAVQQVLLRCLLNFFNTFFTNIVLQSGQFSGHCLSTSEYFSSKKKRPDTPLTVKQRRYSEINKSTLERTPMNSSPKRACHRR